MTRINNKPTTTWMLLLALAGMILMSCNAEVRPDRSTGRTNEILVVTNTKTQWEGGIGHVVRQFFQQPLAGLPQPEPMFHLFNVADEAFNKVFKSQHNILIIDINPGFAEPLVETRSNHWTRPQRVIKITAPDSTSFRRAFDEHKTAFLKAYNENEIVRTNEQFKMARSVKLRNIVEKKFGFTMQIPGGFVVGADDNNFLWLRQSMQKVKQDVELGIIIHERPYIDTNSFAEQEILILRDSLTSKFISGPNEGSFMVLSKDFIPPVFKRMDDFVTGYAVETRGLWMVHNDFMGGPFISYTFVDPSLERVITVDGYVYNPGDLKRNFIRQMEAIFHTISFGD
jgi:hypothetical protein